MKNPTNKKQKSTVINAQPVFYYTEHASYTKLVHDNGERILTQTVIEFLEEEIKIRVEDDTRDWGLCFVTDNALVKYNSAFANYVAFCFCRMLKLQVPPGRTCENAIFAWGNLLDSAARSGKGLLGCKYVTHRTVFPAPYDTNKGKAWRLELLRMLIAFLQSRPEKTIEEVEDNIRFEVNSEVRSVREIVAAYESLDEQ